MIHSQLSISETVISESISHVKEYNWDKIPTCIYILTAVLLSQTIDI